MATPQASSSSSVAEHLGRVLGSVERLAPMRVPIPEALGRVLAEDVIAHVDVPGFDNSAMDGYAVRRADLADRVPVSLEVVADVPAGAADDPPLAAGQVARIMTGAAVPADADAVVPIEDTDEGHPTVLVREAPAEDAFVRKAGTDARRGALVLEAGRVLGARDLAAAAATGSSSLLVFPAPRIGVLSTGSELRPPGTPLERGQIHDSNAALLIAAIEETGGIPVPLGRIADDEAALRDVLERNAQDIDAFVSSGGVSVGAFDIVKAVLAPLGVWFGAVRMQPGKPQGFGRFTDGTPIFGLPGNPVSVFVSFEAFVRPALLVLQGRLDLHRPVEEAVAAEGWRSPAGRAQYLPVRSSRAADGTLSVRPASAGGSASYLVASLAAADALAIVSEDVTEVRAGDTVAVTLVG